MQIPEFKEKLFNGSGEIPSVHGLQSWIGVSYASDEFFFFELIFTRNDLFLVLCRESLESRLRSRRRCSIWVVLIRHRCLDR